MGATLVKRLLDGGHEVTVWNRSPGKAAELVSAGAREASSIAVAARDAEVVLVSLSDDAAVRAVALGEGGLRASLQDGTSYVETSTVSPRLTEELAGIFPSFVAMPILGGPASVLAGQARYFPAAPTPRLPSSNRSCRPSVARSGALRPLALPAPQSWHLTS